MAARWVHFELVKEGFFSPRASVFPLKSRLR